MWRHFPWLLGLILSPLLFGSVTSEGQAVVGILLGASLLLLAGQRGRFVASSRMSVLNCLVVLLLLLPLIPLPSAFLKVVDPERVALAESFPLEPSGHSSWLPITVSPEGTLIRWWELSLVVATFLLSRHAAAQERNGRWLALTVGLGIALLAGSDVWYRLHDQSRILGLWQVSWGKSAGTFANRNHFADWLCVASVFVAGWIIRSLKPLHSARVEGSAKGERSIPDACFLAVIGAFGLAMALLSQSRGGAIVLFAGVIAGIGLLNVRSRRSSRWAIVGMVLTAAVLIGIVTGGQLFERLLRTHSDFEQRGYPKVEIWRQSASVWSKFPMAGTGLGAFETAMSHYKTGGADYVILHAENEYLELLVETGLIGFLVIAVWGFRFSSGLWRFALREKMWEPELVLSGLAALSGFAVHAVFEFVFHITATALLAGAILGYVTGARDRVHAPVATPPLSIARISLNLLAGAALLAAGLMQGLSFSHWHRASSVRIASEIRSEFEKSVDLWPFNDARVIALARSRVASAATDTRAVQIREAVEARRTLQHSLSWNPYSWQLRLERAWLDLASLPDRQRAREEAFETVRLSPLQSKIPLRFAGQFRDSDPDFAMQMLREIKSPDDTMLAKILEYCWQITGQTSDLWAMTPDTVRGLNTLAGFALERNLAPLAAQAYERLQGRVDPVRLAEDLVQARRPDLALEQLGKASLTPAGQLVAIRAHIQAGDFEKAISMAESVWQKSPHWQKITTPVGTTGDVYAHRARWKADPRDRKSALQLAEKEFEQPPDKRDLPLLRQLSFQFNDELRLAWMVYRAEADLKQSPAAAESALHLAKAALTP